MAEAEGCDAEFRRALLPHEVTRTGDLQFGDASGRSGKSGSVRGTFWGQTINYSGTGTDVEDGNLPASAFTWQIDFHHDTHVHPFLPPTSGSTRNW